jgi:hypothetical protein
MLVLTPSYRPDHALCVELNRSVLRLAPPAVRHALVVPPADLGLFRSLAGERTTVQDARAVVPRPLRKIPGLNLWLDLRAPFPPVRGWVAQQVVKLAAAAAADADLVLLADSDLVFVRPFGPRTFAPDGAVPLHVRWHEVARRLLGLPPGDEPARPDYVCWPCLWEPAVVRRMLARVEAVTGLPWAAAVGRELHVSEMVLYGVYVDELEGRHRAVPHTDDMRCPAYSDEAPLDRDGLAAFLARVRLRDVAVMVSAKSGTALDLRRALIAARVPG